MKKPTLQELARRIAALECVMACAPKLIEEIRRRLELTLPLTEPAPLDYTNNCLNCDRGWTPCPRWDRQTPPNWFFCSKHSALREEEDHSPSEPSWRYCGIPRRVAWSKHGWRLEFWASSTNEWMPYSYGVFATLHHTRDLAQAALDARGKARAWTDLRKPHVRRWTRNDSVLYAKQIDLGDGREHWAAVSQTGEGIALTSVVPGSWDRQAVVEELLGKSADFSGWPETEQ